MTEFSIETCEDLPPKDELGSIVAQYYAGITESMQAVGVELNPDAPRSALDECLTHATDDLPHSGCLVATRDVDGTLIGCGMRRRLDPEASELMRVFVTKAAHQTGTRRDGRSVRASRA